jgi:selenocysteine lyase/cysteine desulfurase
VRARYAQWSLSTPPREIPIDALLEQWRSDTPGTAHRVHLNNAGAGLMPASVLAAIRSHLEREADIGGYESEDEAAPRLQEAYAAVAALLHATPRNVAIVENATVAFYQALSAFDFRPGDVIVTTRNDYISNQLAYLSLAQRCGVVIRRAEDLATGGVDPDSVRALLAEPRVRLLAVTWVPTNSGLIQPVETLGEIAAAAGVPYLIDACQAVGQLPVDVRRLRCDFLSATARKFLRGPRGVGFLCVSDQALERGLFPLYIDMRGGLWQSADRFALVPDARRFENWEFAHALVLGLGAAARYAAEVGIERGGGRARALAARLRSALAAVPGLRVLDRGLELAAIVTVEVEGRRAPDIVRELRARRINTSAAMREYAVIDMDEKRAATAVRLSPHYYNTDAELALAVEALRTAAGGGR